MQHRCYKSFLLIALIILIAVDVKVKGQPRQRQRKHIRERENDKKTTKKNRNSNKSSNSNNIYTTSINIKVKTNKTKSSNSKSDKALASSSSKSSTSSSASGSASASQSLDDEEDVDDEVFLEPDLFRLIDETPTFSTTKNQPVGFIPIDLFRNVLTSELDNDFASPSSSSSDPEASSNFMSTQRFKEESSSFSLNNNKDKQKIQQKLKQTEVDEIWSSAMNLEWKRCEDNEKQEISSNTNNNGSSNNSNSNSRFPGSSNNKNKNNKVDKQKAGLSSFLLCYMGKNSDLSGFDRKKAIEAEAKRLGRFLELYESPIYNDDTGMCIYATMNASTAKKITRTKRGVRIQPLASVAKIRRNALDDASNNNQDQGEEQVVEEGGEGIETFSTLSSETTKEAKKVSIVVEISPGILPGKRAAMIHADNLRANIQRDLISTDKRRSLTMKSFTWTSHHDEDEQEDDEYNEQALDKHTHAHARRLLRETSHGNAQKWRRLLNEAHQEGVADYCKTLLNEASIHVETPIKSVRNTFIFEYEFLFDNKNNQDSMPQSCLASYLAGFSVQPSVLSVEKITPPHLLNDHSQWILQSDQLNKRPWYEVGLTGKNQIIQVSDSGLDTNNCYFYDNSSGERKDGTVQLNRRKVVQYVSSFGDNGSTYHDHGTHVVGTVLGRKSTNGSTETNGMVDGVARDARVAFFDVGKGTSCCFIPPSVSSLFNPGKNAGAKIHNASWGTSFSGYSSFSSSIDSYIYNNDDMLMFVAAGNNGSNNRMNSIGDPATAKNIIAIGASESYGLDLTAGMKGKNYLASFSSRGPTDDNRLKPDVVAPGHSILSAGSIPTRQRECDPNSRPRFGSSTNNMGVEFMSGTSMASPGAAGAGAMVRQYLEEGFYPTGSKNNADRMNNPSAALVKAILINGAQPLIGINNSGNVTPLGGNSPDNHQGFGKINLLKSLRLNGKNSKIRNFIQDRKSISSGGQQSFDFTINKAQQCNEPFKATLVWTDPPNTSGCSKCLKNDLDLKLKINNSNSRIIYPNGRTTKESRNNVERCIFPDGNTGDTVRVIVNAANLATASQKYALVVSGCINDPNAPPPPPSPPSPPTPVAQPTPFPTKPPVEDPEDPEEPLVSTLELVLTTDRFSEETSWTLKDLTTETIIESSPQNGFQRNRLYRWEFELERGKQQKCYEFEIKDIWGDGICCRYGNGGYEGNLNNRLTIFEGGRFRFKQTHEFCIMGDDEYNYDMGDDEGDDEEQPECYTSWNQLKQDVEAANKQYTSFDICPLTTMDVDGDTIDLDRDGLTIQCGSDGDRSNRCVFRGDGPHLRIKANDIQINGISFQNSRNGGVLEATSGEGTQFTGCYFIRNYMSSEDDAAVGTFTGNAQVTFSKCTIAVNKGPQGSFLLSDDSHVTFDNCKLQANRSTSSSSSSNENGIVNMLGSANLSLQRTCFIRNRATGPGIVMVKESARLLRNYQTSGQRNTVSNGLSNGSEACRSILFDSDHDQGTRQGQCMLFASSNCLARSN